MNWWREQWEQWNVDREMDGGDSEIDDDGDGVTVAAVAADILRED